MKKKLIPIIAMACMSIVALAGCNKDTTHRFVTDDYVVVGNTAPTAGALSFVGLPFNNGMEAAFWNYNKSVDKNDDTKPNRVIELVNRPDDFTATTGIPLTKQLVEEDKVFALAGHFGTPTVAGTVNYIRDKGIPMLYAATGVNALLAPDGSAHDPVMPVQPIYRTEGQITVARVVTERIYGPNKNLPFPANGKIGVLYTETDDGRGILSGITDEAFKRGLSSAQLPRYSFVDTDAIALATTVNQLLADGVAAIIVAANQAPFKASLKALHDAGNTAPVYTSYVSAASANFDAAVNYTFDSYINNWLDVTSGTGLADAIEFATIITEFNDGDATYATNPYAQAGWVAGSMFAEAFKRIDNLPTEEITWAKFIAAVESAPLNIPMGGDLDFANGSRTGIRSMGLLKYDPSDDAKFIIHAPITSLEDLNQSNYSI